MLWLSDVISIIYPELLVLLAIVLAIIFINTENKAFAEFSSVALLILGIVHIIKTQFSIESPIQILNGMFIADNLSILLRFLTLCISTLVILGSIKYMNGFTHKGEYLIILLTAVLGVLFLIGANDLITLFVSLETLSLSSILLVGYAKYDSRSNEASIKYLLNGAAASAILLFGFSLIYGLCGSTQFNEIRYKVSELASYNLIDHQILVIAIICIVSGIAFKLAAAPMHMWSPDVYEGAPTPTTAFLSTVSKIGGFAISLRLLVNVFGFLSTTWQPMLVSISILSMIIGNFTALAEVAKAQNASIKRLMAYSSIAQVGYILIGPALANEAAISSSIFYLIIYSIVNIGAFLCIIAFGNETNSDLIKDYSGLFKKKPLLTFALVICLFNLAGLPIPPAGFIAKFLLLKAAFDSGTIGIIIGSFALITTLLSVYYYTYIAKIALVDESSNAVKELGNKNNVIGKSKALKTAISVAVFIIFLITLSSSPILGLSNKSSESISYNLFSSTCLPCPCKHEKCCF